MQDIDPNNYDAHLVRAIYYFSHDHDITRAKEEIRKAKNDRNAAWQYSDAFLSGSRRRMSSEHIRYISAPFWAMYTQRLRLTSSYSFMKFWSPSRRRFSFGIVLEW